MDGSTMAEEAVKPLQGSSTTTLPDDILYHIHAFMQMRDAAQAACVSRAFLRSWRSYPKIILDMYTLGLLLEADYLSSFDDPIDEELPSIIEDQINNGVIATIQDYFQRNDPMVREFVARVDHIMRNHIGTGIAIFRLRPPSGFYIDPDILDRWFQAVIPQGILHFAAFLDMGDDSLGYTFPCSSLLSSDSKGCSTITSLTLTGCRLDSRPVGCLVSLRRVDFHKMRVTGDELGCFLSSASAALEELELSCCQDIVCLSIPRLLSRLKLLHVANCNSLQKIQCEAANLSIFSYVGLPTTSICLGDSGPIVKQMTLSSSSVDEHGMLSYSTTKIPTVAPNLRFLSLSSCFEVAADTQIKRLTKFRHLKYLKIRLHTPSRCPDYDFYSLVSFLNACPALQTFVLQLEMRDDAAAAAAAIPGDSHGDYSSSQEKKHGGTTAGQCPHRKLKKVLISGFRSAKGLVELTNHILENAASLKQLVLDTAYDRNIGHCMCAPLTRNALVEAIKAVDVINRCIKCQVPSSVKFKVIEPCIKCHTDEACRLSRIIE